MNMLRLTAVATTALIGTGAWAQELTPEQAQILAAHVPATASASQDVGGVAPGGGEGAPQGVTRQQVDQAGQLQMIQNSVYRGQF